MQEWAAGWAEQQLSLPGLLHRLPSGTVGFIRIVGLVKTSWAKSTAVGSRLSLLPCIFFTFQAFAALTYSDVMFLSFV